jgi:hypothetical protein
MSYSASSTLKGSGTATAATIDTWMQAMGRQLAPTYAPDKAYQPPPEIGLTIIDLCAQVGVNSDLVAAQVAKESAGWQSAIVRAKNNPSGIGAINSNPMGGATTFATPAAGIRATIAHLLSYVDGTANPWWSDDPRATAIPSGNLGVVHQLSDLDGRWAVPGVGYGAGIAALANQLVASAPQTTGGTATVTRIIVSAGHENIGQITGDKGINAAQLRNGTGALGREAEWTAPWADALVAKLRALGIDAVRTDAIYHADVYGKDADLLIIGHCDGTGTKRTQWCMAGAVISGGSTDAADNRAAAFVAIWNQVYPAATGIANNGPITNDMTEYYGGWYRTPTTPAVLVEHFILGNGGVWSNDLTPQQGADADAKAIAQWLGIAQAQSVTPAQPVDPDHVFFKDTQHWLSFGFKAFWEKFGGLAIFGYPISEEFTESGLTVQYFEKGQRFELHPDSNGNPPNEWHVMLGNVGAEHLVEMKAKFPEAFTAQSGQ